MHTLKKSLLEHRRKHNIFEVGDCIVDTVTNQFFKIIDIDGGDLLVEQRFWVDSLYQRHATNEEIAAGHRLPQLEALNDIDISPNTIILGDK